MAAFDTTRPTYGSNGFFSRIAFYIALIAGAYAAWNDARITRNALAALSDHELEDIGLVRGDIDLVAEGRTQVL